jgi:hypothetical protein
VTEVFLSYMSFSQHFLVNVFVGFIVIL